MHAMKLNQLAKHTKSCRSENGPAIAHASVTSNISDLNTFSEQNNVGLVTWDYHIFLINPLFHIDNCFIIAIVWSKVDSISDGGEVPVPSAATISTLLGSYSLANIRVRLSNFFEIHVGTPTSTRRRLFWLCWLIFWGNWLDRIERELLTCLCVSVMEFSRAGFKRPEAESSDSKHVSLFVSAALR